MTDLQPAPGKTAPGENHALVIGRFASLMSASLIHDELATAASNGLVTIYGMLVVEADKKGHLRVQQMDEHSTRSGFRWGLGAGVVAAVLLPEVMLPGAIAAGILGATVGKSRNLARTWEVQRDLAPFIPPGTCGLLCLCPASDVAEIELRMPTARAFKTVPVDPEVADAVRAAVAAAKGS